VALQTGRAGFLHWDAESTQQNSWLLKQIVVTVPEGQLGIWPAGQSAPLLHFKTPQLIFSPSGSHVIIPLLSIKQHAGLPVRHVRDLFKSEQYPSPIIFPLEHLTQAPLLLLLDGRIQIGLLGAIQLLSAFKQHASLIDPKHINITVPLGQFGTNPEVQRDPLLHFICPQLKSFSIQSNVPSAKVLQHCGVVEGHAGILVESSQWTLPDDDTNTIPSTQDILHPELPLEEPVPAHIGTWGGWQLNIESTQHASWFPGKHW
jgi:hypothetical protein